MNAKIFLVSFIAAISILCLVATVSAFTGDLTSNEEVKVEGINAFTDDVSVIAGEEITVEVIFESLKNASDVRIKAEIEGSKVDSEERTSLFDVENGKRYRKVLTIQVPYDLNKELSDTVDLIVTVSNKDFESEDEFSLRVQRPSYQADIKSVTVKQTIEAGETIPVDVVLKNVGYNELDDVFVSVSIPALGVQSGKKFLGDLVSLEDRDCGNDAICLMKYDDRLDDEDTDTVTARVFLDIPFDVEGGVYSLEVAVEGNDVNAEAAKQIIVKNDVSETVIQSGDNIVLVNPTSKIKVYKIIPEFPATVSESVVAVPADSSKTVTIDADSDKEFKVSVFSGDTLVKTVTFGPSADDNGNASGTSPLVALTIVLAIIFVVLLIVLIVMITRKPEKVEEFGESYY